jgi:hypothetical protein
MRLGASLIVTENHQWDFLGLNRRRVTALFVGNLGDNFLHLHETHGRYRVRSPDPNIVGVLSR